MVESGVKIGKGVLRVHLLALESRIQGRLPCGHPAFAWLVQHSSSVLTKSLVGKDGRTPYGRLFGKEVAEEGLEFGELLRWRLPRLVGHNTLLEARWRAGVWLGRVWASPTHLVYDLEGKCVKEVRAAQCMPRAVRWGREAFQAVDEWPRRLEPAREVGEARVVPEAIPPEAAPPPGAPLLRSGEARTRSTFPGPAWRRTGTRGGA